MNFKTLPKIRDIDGCEEDWEGWEDNCEVDCESEEGGEAGPGLGLEAGGWREESSSLSPRVEL